MRLPRSGIIAKIVVFALIVYAGISLITLRGRIDAARDEHTRLRRLVAEKEVRNTELEYKLEHYNEPDVISDIARTGLGLVLPGEIIFYDAGNGHDAAE